MSRLFIVVLFTGNLLLAQDFPRPAYLIENQPIPYALDIRQSLSSAKEQYTLGNESLKFYKKDFMIASHLLPLVQSKDLLIILGAGYSQTNLRSNKRNDLNRDYYGEYLNFFATGTFNEKWNWFSYQSIGWFSNKNYGFDKEATKYFQISKIGYKHTPNMGFSVGLLYSSNLGDDVVLPFMGFAYSRKSFVFETTLPVDMKFRYLWTKKFHTVFIANFLAGSYYDYNSTEKLDYSAIEINLKAEYQVYNWVWLNSALNMTSSEEWHLRYSGQKIKQNGSRINFMIGIEVRPD